MAALLKGQTETDGGRKERVCKSLMLCRSHLVVKRSGPIFQASWVHANKTYCYARSLATRQGPRDNPRATDTLCSRPPRGVAENTPTRGYLRGAYRSIFGGRQAAGGTVWVACESFT